VTGNGSGLSLEMTALHNNKVGVVFTEHTRMVVFFLEVDEHGNISVLLVTHDVITHFDELFSGLTSPAISLTITLVDSIHPCSWFSTTPCG